MNGTPCKWRGNVIYRGATLNFEKYNLVVVLFIFVSSMAAELSSLHAGFPFASVLHTLLAFPLPFATYPSWSLVLAWGRY